MDNLKKNKEKLVIKLYEEGKTTSEIALAHISFREIGRIIRKSNGEKESKVASNQSKAYSIS